MIAITGASGYLGRALLPVLVQQYGHRGGVVVLSRQATAHSPTLHFDLTQTANFLTCLEGVTTLVHCAGVAHAHGSKQAYTAVNVQGTVALAQAALKQGVSRFIFVSSMNVIPKDALSPDSSARAYSQPSNGYGASKWQAERGLEATLADSDCHLVIVRPALVYDTELTGNIALLSWLGRLLPFRLPDVGARPMLCRADFVALITHCIDMPEDRLESVTRRAGFDGQRYSARRIGEAVLGARKMALPLAVWRLMAALYDVIKRQPANTTWTSIGGEFWTGAHPSNQQWQPTWVLEERLLPSTDANERSV